jgi:DNA ligase (NAD+)
MLAAAKRPLAASSRCGRLFATATLPPSFSTKAEPPFSVKEKYQNILKELEKLDSAYYGDDDPLASDAVYDRLRNEKEELERQYTLLDPQHLDTDIGYPPKKFEFATKKHLFPVLSLNNGFTEQSFSTFMKRIRDFLHLENDEEIELVVEPKIDGLSLNIQYQEGKLESKSQNITVVYFFFS